MGVFHEHVANRVLDDLVAATAPLRAHYDVISLYTAPDERIEALTRQTIASAADGSLWSSTRVLHRFTVREGLIAGMESEQDTPVTTFPGVDVLLKRLHAHELDAALLGTEVIGLDLESRSLFAEPFLAALPPEHPLWTTPNAILSMHLSGRSQTRMLARSAALFVENLHAFVEGRALRNEVDLAAGY